MFALDQAKKVLYKGVVTGLRISSIMGQAFIDNANASILALANGGNSIEIYDSAGRMLQGVLKAQGTGETLSNSELITNGDMELDSNWPTYLALTTNERSSDKAHSGTYSRHMADNVIGHNGAIKSELFHVNVGAYYKYVLNTWVVSGTVRNLTVNTSPLSIFESLVSAASWTEQAGYAYAKDSGYAAIESSAVPTAFATEWYFDDISVKQVVAPSSNGATIVNSKEGVVQNFLTKDDDFSYGEYSYMVIIKEIRGPAITDEITGISIEDLRLDLTANNAFCWINGIDLSAYQTGNYMIEIYDSLGRAVVGSIAASTPSGETLDSTALIEDDCSVDNTSDWVSQYGHASVTFDTDHYNFSTTKDGGYNVYKEELISNYGMLVKASLDAKNGSASGITAQEYFWLGENRNEFVTTESFTTYSGGYVIVFPELSGHIRLILETPTNLSGNNIQVKNMWIKRVVDPPSTAVHIIKAKGSSVRSWQFVSGSFNRDDPNGYSCRIKHRL